VPPDCRTAPGFLGPSGLTCLTIPLTAQQLLELLRVGAAFAADWSELRCVTRNRLCGRVVSCDLAAAVEEVTAAAGASGAFGVTRVRCGVGTLRRGCWWLLPGWPYHCPTGSWSFADV
jgi:hypothetical protein